jgi:hypothetical protein
VGKDTNFMAKKQEKEGKMNGKAKKSGNIWMSQINYLSLQRQK